MNSRERKALMTIAFGYALALVLMALTQGGCGPSMRERTLTTTFHATNAARDGFFVWDQQHQDAIVDHAPSLEGGQATLAAYRKAREPIVASFEIVYRALALAAIDSKTPLALAVDAAAKLFQAIELLKAQSSSIEAPTPSSP